MAGVGWDAESALVVAFTQPCGGATLAAALAEGSLSRAHALPVARGVASGLAFLHAQCPPVVHTELTPASVALTLTAAGVTPLLSDFAAPPDRCAEGARCPCPRAVSSIGYA